jgi:thiamine kinase-like enzyme
MKVMNYRYFVLVVSIIAVLLFGCSESQTNNEKRNRIIAAENIKLRKDLEQRDLEIAKLKESYDEELEEQIKLLAELQRQVKALQEKSKQNVRNQVQGVLDAVIEENAKLRQENEDLKNRLETLKKQTDQLEKMLQKTQPQKIE